MLTNGLTVFRYVFVIQLRNGNGSKDLVAVFAILAFLSFLCAGGFRFGYDRAGQMVDNVFSSSAFQTAIGAELIAFSDLVAGSGGLHDPIAAFIVAFGFKRFRV